jgi:HPt (histidine-containing phosphotransfer) domain-containing protein
MSDQQPSVERLRAEIAETRAELARTVDQIADKLDLRTQAGRTVQHAGAAVSNGAQAAVHKLKQTLPNSAAVKLDQAAGGVQRAAASPRVRQNRRWLLLGTGVVLVLLLGRRRRGQPAIG